MLLPLNSPMSFLLTSSLALAIGFSIPAASLLYRGYRRRRLRLRPNCLLTRYPLVYLQRNKNPATRLVDEINEHGYEAFCILWPPHSPQKQHKKLSQALKKIKLYSPKVHLIVPSPLEADFFHAQENLAPDVKSAIQSVTITDSQSLGDHLNIAISLAEKDFQCSH